jgi:DHA1 family bicyclomycin/chloramphenicol resistance-like MFS transporter
VLAVIGSVGCALSAGVTELTIWRVVQALRVGSASVIPRAVIRARFDVAHTARALSLLGLITGFGPILAPQSGGAILLIAGWRLEFWLLSVLGIACFLIAFFTLRESLPASRSSTLGPKLWLRLLTDRRYLKYAIPANLIQSGVFTISPAPLSSTSIISSYPRSGLPGCSASTRSAS